MLSLSHSGEDLSHVAFRYTYDIVSQETANKAREVAVMEPINNSHNQMVCPDCSSTIKVDLTATQYKEYEEEARIRYLKAQKVGGDKVAMYDRQSQV